jgi:tRNA threonylcarbamoyladenosine biosynthesis protein TsaE
MDEATGVVMKTWTVQSPDAQHLQMLGQALGHLKPTRICVALLGDLGAGKTTLSQGLGQGLDLSSSVTSPTFGLMMEHEGPCPMLHVDAYRLEPGEAEGIGLEEALDAWPGLAVVEWADLVVSSLPEDVIFVRLSHRSLGREVQVWGVSESALSWVVRWHEALQ